MGGAMADQDAPDPFALGRTLGVPPSVVMANPDRARSIQADQERRRKLAVIPGLQLMYDAGASEEDISWAERFLNAGARYIARKGNATLGGVSEYLMYVGNTLDDWEAQYGSAIENENRDHSQLFLSAAVWFRMKSNKIDEWGQEHPMSPEAAEAAENFLETYKKENIWKAVTGVIDDGMGGVYYTLEGLAESLPDLVISGGVAAVAGGATRGAATAPAFALSNGLLVGGVERYANVNSFLKRHGVDLHDPDQVRAALSNSALMKEAAEDGISRGLILGFAAGISSLNPAKIGNSLVRNGVNASFGTTVSVAGEAGVQVATEGEITDPGQIVLSGATGLTTQGFVSFTGHSASMVGNRSRAEHPGNAENAANDNASSSSAANDNLPSETHSSETAPRDAESSPEQAKQSGAVNDNHPPEPPQPGAPGAGLDTNPAPLPLRAENDNVPALHGANDNGPASDAIAANDRPVSTMQGSNGSNGGALPPQSVTQLNGPSQTNGAQSNAGQQSQPGAQGGKHAPAAATAPVNSRTFTQKRPFSAADFITAVQLDIQDVLVRMAGLSSLPGYTPTERKRAISALAGNKGDITLSPTIINNMVANGGLTRAEGATLLGSSGAPVMPFEQFLTVLSKLPESERAAVTKDVAEIIMPHDQKTIDLIEKKLADETNRIANAVRGNFNDFVTHLSTLSPAKRQEVIAFFSLVTPELVVKDSGVKALISLGALTQAEADSFQKTAGGAYVVPFDKAAEAFLALPAGERAGKAWLVFPRKKDATPETDRNIPSGLHEDARVLRNQPPERIGQVEFYGLVDESRTAVPQALQTLPNSQPGVPLLSTQSGHAASATGNTSLLLTPEGVKLLQTPDPVTGQPRLSEQRVAELQAAAEQAGMLVSDGYVSVPRSELQGMMQGMDDPQLAGLSEQVAIFNGRDAFTPYAFDGVGKVNPATGQWESSPYLPPATGKQYPGAPVLTQQAALDISQIQDPVLRDLALRVARSSHIVQRHVVKPVLLERRVSHGEDPASGSAVDAITGGPHEKPKAATGFKSMEAMAWMLDKVWKYPDVQAFMQQQVAAFTPSKHGSINGITEVRYTKFNIPLSSIMDGRDPNAYFEGFTKGPNWSGGSKLVPVDFTGQILAGKIVAYEENGSIYFSVETMFPKVIP
jgi:hypothetical protein